MERLTKRGTRKNGYVSAIGSGLGCWEKIIDRLAAYEDTGLEPEEVADLQRAWDMYGGEEGITAMPAPPNPPADPGGAAGNGWGAGIYQICVRTNVCHCSVC